MEKIKLKRSLFKDLISDTTRSLLHNDLVSENKGEFNLDSFSKYPIIIGKLVDDLEKQDFNDQDNEIARIYQNYEIKFILFKIRYDDLNNMSLNKEITLHKIDWLRLYEKHLYADQFNQDIFTLNINYLIISVIQRIDAWHNELVTNIIINGQKEFFKLIKKKDFYNKQMQLNYFMEYMINCLLLDIYNAYDSFKCYLLLMSKNVLLTERNADQISSNSKNKARLRNMKLSQKNSFNELCNLINDIQAQTNIKKVKFEEIARKLQLIDCEGWENIEWIISQRNNLTHNYLSIEHDTSWLSTNTDIMNFNLYFDKTKKIKIIYILFVNFILLFYATLETFDCLE